MNITFKNKNNNFNKKQFQSKKGEKDNMYDLLAIQLQQTTHENFMELISLNLFAL